MRLPNPFNFCANAGSHLSRLSEFRWKPTSFVLAFSLIQLFLIYQAKYTLVKFSSKSIGK